MPRAAVGFPGRSSLFPGHSQLREVRWPPPPRAGWGTSTTYDRRFAASELRKYRLKGRFRRLVD
jgi:hypothetical protein